MSLTFYIIDLFNTLEQAIKDYTSGAFAEFDKEDVEGLLKDRLSDAKKSLGSVKIFV